MRDLEQDIQASDDVTELRALEDQVARAVAQVNTAEEEVN